jgi:hypothetical protein
MTYAVLGAGKGLRRAGKGLRRFRRARAASAGLALRPEGLRRVRTTASEAAQGQFRTQEAGSGAAQGPFIASLGLPGVAQGGFCASQGIAGTTSASLRIFSAAYPHRLQAPASPQNSASAYLDEESPVPRRAGGREVRDPQAARADEAADAMQGGARRLCSICAAGSMNGRRWHASSSPVVTT